MDYGTTAFGQEARATPAARIHWAPNGLCDKPTKSKIWPTPNYKRLVKEGASPVNVRVFRAMYEWVATRPRHTLPNASFHFQMAVLAFRDAAERWLMETPSPTRGIGVDMFSAALNTIMGYAWGRTSHDPSYFTARHDLTDRGRQLHVLLGKESPYHRLPKTAAMDSIRRQLTLGWPAPRPSWESKGFFVVEKSAISIFQRSDGARAVWANSMANDHGFVNQFDSTDEAQEWLDELAPYLVMTERPSTRILSTHQAVEEARATARDRAVQARRK